MATQFIDLAREITHSPFPKRLRSVTWSPEPPLVGVSHEPGQSNTTGNKQQAGGWNSGAVALLAITIANTSAAFLNSGNNFVKPGEQRTRLASKI